MARSIGKLTALQVDKAKQPGMYGDGGGLWLRVTPDGAKNWIFRYMLNGRPHWMGMGPVHTINLAEARKRAAEHRLRRHDGVDPIEARRAERLQARLAEAKAITFKECADSYLKAHHAGWRNPKHAAQWESTLSTYAYPQIGRFSIQAIDTALVMRVLEQEIRKAPDSPPATLWRVRPETASRLRGRIERVLDWAKAREYRTGENPARWRGHLDLLLPPKSKITKVKHHPALPYDQIPEFMPKLRAAEGIAARALEFLILTSTRTGDIRGNDREDRQPLKWKDVDLRKREWLVPATKTDVEHKVPLSDPAVAVLKTIQSLNLPGDIVFQGDNLGAPLSDGALLRVLDRIAGYEQYTPHGFRATFKTWAGERTNFQHEVIEAVLAHGIIDDKLEAAYRRGDFFEKRRRLMNAWAEFCSKPVPQAKVMQLRRAG